MGAGDSQDDLRNPNSQTVLLWPETFVIFIILSPVSGLTVGLTQSRNQEIMF